MSSRAMSTSFRLHVVVIGAGFCSLAAAYELGKHGVRTTVLECDDDVGGLAGSFLVGGTRLEKFYHHWFTNDVHVMRLIEELEQTDRVLRRPSRTGMYYAHDFFKLSTPVDLLRFSPLPLRDRVRLGLLALRARRVQDWRSLEDRTAADWLRELGGERVYRVVWEPLLRGKFGDVVEEVAAVWFWNKLKLRGGSRGKRGERTGLLSGGLALTKNGYRGISGQFFHSRYFCFRNRDKITIETVFSRHTCASRFLIPVFRSLFSDFCRRRNGEGLLSRQDV